MAGEEQVVVIHGIGQTDIPRSSVEKSIWKLFFIIALVVFSSLWVPTVRQYFLAESLIASSVDPPTTYPVIHICPEDIPDDAVRAAGYGSSVAKKLRTVTRYAWARQDIDPEPEATSETGLAAGDDDVGETIQEILLAVGSAHRDILQIDAHEKFFGISMHGIIKTVSVTSIGYCFTYEFEDRTLGSNSLGHMYMKVPVVNGTALAEAGSVGLIVSTYDKVIFLPPKTTFQAGEVRVQAQWHNFLRRPTPKKPCESDNKTIDECVVACTESSEASKQNNETEECEHFSPLSGQSLSRICDGYSYRQKAQKRLAMAKICAAQCVRSCAEGHFTYNFQYLDPDRLDTSQQSGDTKEWALNFHIQIVGIFGAIRFVEDKAVTFSIFFGYTGGNLGVLFGVTIFALVEWIESKIFRMLKLKTKTTRASKKVWKAQKLAASGFKICVLAMSLPFLIDLMSMYHNKVTTSTIYIQNLVKTPRLLFVMSWLSEEKMMNILQLPASFWAEEQSRFEAKNNTFPYMCHLVQALMLGNPILDKFDRTIPGYLQHIDDLAKVLDQSAFLQEHGAQQVVLNSTYDPQTRITGVIDRNNQPYQFSSAIRQLGVILAYEVLLNDSDRTHFASRGTGNRVIFPRVMPSDTKCHWRDEGIGVLLRENEEGVAYNVDNFIILESADYSFYVSAQRIESKNKKDRICYEDIVDGSYCIQDCMDTMEPCPCDAMYYGEGKVAKITNVTKMCHKLRPLMQQCQLSRAILHQTKMDACKAQCYQSCKRTSYYATVYSRSPESTTHQKIDIILVGNTGNFHVSEFYSFNMIKLLCALGAVFSMFFGYSFVTIFNTVEDTASKVVSMKKKKKKKNTSRAM